MKRILVTLSTFLLAFCTACLLSSCASHQSQEAIWQPSQTGCSNHSLGDSLLWWETAPLSWASYRLAIQPDTGQGPTILVILDSGKSNPWGDPDGRSTQKSPVFIGAVGDSSRTCVINIPFSKCPAATSVYNMLQHKSIPLGFDMDNPLGVTILHAPTYYLDYSDGQGNFNQWRFYGSDHPLQKVIRNSINKLKSCWAPALKAYGAR